MTRRTRGAQLMARIARQTPLEVVERLHAEAAEDRLTFFVPTELVNALNAREHWGMDHKRTVAQKDAVALALYRALGGRWRLNTPPERAKRITFRAQVARLFDTEDGLPPALKHVRDALMGCGLIHNDDPTSGHEFVYEQVVATPRGLHLTIELRRG